VTNVAGIALIVGLVAATLTVVSLLWPSWRKPFAYAGRKLVTEPLSNWIRGLVGEVVVAKLQTPNGGSSTIDISRKVDQLAKQVSTIREKQVEMTLEVREVRREQRTVAAHLSDTKEALAEDRALLIQHVALHDHQED
jgi:outer membrane murein-binding lipoprotein Lpp